MREWKRKEALYVCSDDSMLIMKICTIFWPVFAAEPIGLRNLGSDGKLQFPVHVFKKLGVGLLSTSIRKLFGLQQLTNMSLLLVVVELFQTFFQGHHALR